MPLLAKNTNKRFLARDYHQKKLENPFFKKKNRIVSWVGLKTKLIVIGAGIILVAIFWFLCLSSFWKIKGITISGLDQMADADIRNMISEQVRIKNFLILPQNNLLFFKVDKFQEALKGRYRFQKISIQKKWPDKLVITITEKPVIGVWNEGGKYCYVDVDGYIVQELNPINIKDRKYPIITNESGEKIYDSRIHVDIAYLAAAAYLYEKITAATLGTSIDRFIIDNEMDAIKIVVPEGPIISFDAKGDLDAQLDRLYILKTQKFKNDFLSQKKINLRFSDKIYYE